MKILVGGVGNVLMSDDGFGVEVVHRLSRRTLPGDVHVVDFGVRGLDLTYALLGGYDAAIVVDVAQRGGAPGTLYVIEPLVEPVDGISLDAHSMQLDRVLATARSMGKPPPFVRLIACEPATLGEDDDLAMELSAPVERAVEPAMGLVEALIAEARGAEVAHA
jgi:hydrogenase maturation protease